ETGGAQAVAEAWRNITATGATPLAITNNMNFGNPERPRIMGQFVGCIKGMTAAALALDFPVVSGNVSLYNETNGVAILPTPVIGGVGMIADAALSVGLAIPEAGLSLILIGETKGHLGQSIFMRDLMNRTDGAPPPVDLTAERRNGDCVRQLITGGHVAACHDLSDGGLAVALADMAIAGGVGVTMDAAPSNIALHAWLYGEDQARYLVATKDEAAVLAACEKVGVPAQRVGISFGTALTLPGGDTISVEDLAHTHDAPLPNYMAGASWSA
ncbi:MAG TPA: phosphoribosylformylglycinamidine synthase II, partial [Rhodospirillaceae bacterium]|nr:phosphoribosylformylglycinamidine synthase II [Rhodospirillaceae bacterium]